MTFLRHAAAAALALGFLAAPALAQDFSPKQKTDIQQIVRDYLVSNPEVLRDAMMELDRRQRAEEASNREKALSENASVLTSSPYQAVVGNPNGKVTMVEFFDYNCGYCKKALGDLARLIKDEPELRVVLKEMPVLGPGSVEAAQVASAVRTQFKGDRYWDFHQKLLLTRGQVGKANAMAVAKELGADMEKLDRDMKAPEVRAGITEVLKVADQLSLTGTPSYVLGNEIVVGAVGYDELRGKISNMKKCGKAACS